MKNLPINTIKKGVRNPQKAVKYIYRSAISSSAAVFDRPITNILGRQLYNYDWDCAIILDACRYDTACGDSATARLLGDPERVYSAGANSARWLDRTFTHATAKQRKETHYVTANIFSEAHVPEKVNTTELWRNKFDEALSTVPPDVVTDTAIQIGREESPERLLVHYMQPHLPPINQSLDMELDLDFRDGWGDNNPWQQIEAGNIDGEIVADAYQANLPPAIDSIEILLNNLDAERVIITADHGNMLGEFGRWGHFRGNAMHPAVRSVPWWETSATDSGEYVVNENISTSSSDDDLSRDDKLRALGYL